MADGFDNAQRLRSSKEYATMCEAVDEWLGPHDAHALAEEAEALDILLPGRGIQLM